MSCTYLAHHELESEFVDIIVIKGMGYLLYGAADSAVAKIGIDLDQEVAAHNGRFQLCVALVGGDDGSPPCHLHTMVVFFKFVFLF